MVDIQDLISGQHFVRTSNGSDIQMSSFEMVKTMSAIQIPYNVLNNQMSGYQMMTVKCS
jgi:hypothetical protein